MLRFVANTPPKVVAPGTSVTIRLPSTRLSTSGSVPRSEEHTSELQSRGHLVCRLLLEKINEKDACDYKGLEIMYLFKSDVSLTYYHAIDLYNHLMNVHHERRCYERVSSKSK